MLLAIMRGLPAAARLRGALRAGGDEDRPARLLAIAVRGLPPAHGEWGAAMCAELGAVRGTRGRWAFAAGCARAAVVLRLRAGILAPERGGTGMRMLMLAAIVAVLSLGLYGVARYPSLLSGTGGWATFAAFVAILALHAAGALSLTRGSTRQAAFVRCSGAGGGLAIAAAWLAIVVPGGFPRALVVLPLAAALLVPAAVAVLVARSTRQARAGTDAALWSGLTGSLLAFAVWLPATYASDGRPYDARLMRDFQRSGGHDLAAYAVGDTLGAAIGLLVIVPLMALALGSLGARLTERAI